LKAAIESAETLDTEGLSEESLKAIADVVSEAKLVLEFPASQENVDTMVAKINEVLEAAQSSITKVTGLIAEAVDYKTIQLSWNAVAIADQYVVERLSAEGDWIKVAKTTEPTYVANGVKTGKEYTYRVKAMKADEVFEASEEASATPTLSGEVELTLTPNGSNQFDLTWTAVEGATRYIIYRKSDTSAWKKILTLGKDARSYTSKAMAEGTYTYQVKAARYDSVDRVMTNGSNEVVGVATSEVLTLNAEKASDTQVTITWNKLSTMKYYDVYRATSVNGKYTLLKRTTATTTTNTVKAGKTYYYKVRAYNVMDGVKVYTNYSEVLTYIAQ
ncbi:MAG: fibronectin type III domain-containing protein, partial [Longicatena sp.]|nr:fibronectin type III domain-containing protein [Longicatena sp.]